MKISNCFEHGKIAYTPDLQHRTSVRRSATRRQLQRWAIARECQHTQVQTDKRQISQRNTHNLLRCAEPYRRANPRRAHLHAAGVALQYGTCWTVCEGRDSIARQFHVLRLAEREARTAHCTMQRRPAGLSFAAFAAVAAEAFSISHCTRLTVSSLRAPTQEITLWGAAEQR